MPGSPPVPPVQGYDIMAQRMVQLASRQPGFLGVESARESLGITVPRPVWRWTKTIKNYGTTKEKHWICIFLKDESPWHFFLPCEEDFFQANYVRHIWFQSFSIVLFLSSSCNDRSIEVSYWASEEAIAAWKALRNRVVWTIFYGEKYGGGKCLKGRVAKIRWK